MLLRTKHTCLNVPHCDCMVQITQNEINCQLFRHAVMKSTYNQINPHAPKVECGRLVEMDLIFGCGKPFRMCMLDGKWSYAEECDYI